MMATATTKRKAKAAQDAPIPYPDEIYDDPRYQPTERNIYFLHPADEVFETGHARVAVPHVFAVKNPELAANITDRQRELNRQQVEALHTRRYRGLFDQSIIPRALWNSVMAETNLATRTKRFNAEIVKNYCTEKPNRELNWQEVEEDRRLIVERNYRRSLKQQAIDARAAQDRRNAKPEEAATRDILNMTLENQKVILALANQRIANGETEE